MKFLYPRLCLAVSLIASTASAFSQQQIAVFSSAAPEGYDLEVEVVTEDVGILVGALGVTDLTGYSCTRLYVTMNNTTDFMSSVSGDSTNPTLVETTTNFYHAALGAATPNGINSLLFAVYPDLPFDSWVTIGLEGVPNASIGEAAIATVQSTDNPWSTNFDPGFGAPGGNIAIDDPIGGAWYALNGDANGVAGDDLKVLVGQFTTDGELSGQLYCQVFIEGDGAVEFRDTFYFGAGGPVLGCSDATACNYDELATDDDGSCEYPLDLYGSAFVDCDGECLSDVDGDEVCDEDEVAGCQDETACNFSSAATDDDGSCTYAADNYDCDGNCINDADGDGVCDELEVSGCDDDTACNFDSDATENDGSCAYPDQYYDCNGDCINDADLDGVCDELEVPGCDDDTACNYDTDATENDGSCNYPAQFYDCGGNCINDGDNDGICDELETVGCTDGEACNYSSVATEDDGSCTYPASDLLDCAGNCINDSDGDGVCDEEEVPGCDDEGACNFDSNATDDDGSCEYTSCAGCTNDAACNYDNTATIDDGSCALADGPCETCNPDGTVAANDADNDGVCDADEILGCTEPSACNYDSNPTTDTDNSLCEYPIDLYGVDNVDCDGNCLNDADEDLVCDEDEVPGCDDATACNYDTSATDNDGSCVFADDPCETCNADGTVNPNDDDGDGVCNADEVLGCTEPSACNYDGNPTTDTDNSLCEYPIDLYGVDNVDCEGSCLNDVDMDEVCDEDEIVGCQDEGACNYDATATDAGACSYADLGYDCDGVCLNDADGDGVCDEFEVEGCTDEVACNYAEAATEEDGSCTYPTEFYLDCDGACLNDEDGDGLCDEVEALIPPDYNPDWNGDYCYTVADLTHLLCLFGTCGLDTTGGPDYNPFFGEDSCYSAFDLIPFLTLFQTCLEVEEAGSPVGGNAPAGDGMNDGMNDDGVTDDDDE
jgi:hypothetical protein